LDHYISIEAARKSPEASLAMGNSMIHAIARAFSGLLRTQDVKFAGLDGVMYIE
jgi:hypothetical protein